MKVPKTHQLNRLRTLLLVNTHHVSSKTLTGIKTSGSEPQGQEGAACVCFFRPTQPLQCVIYMDGSSKILKYCSSAAITAIT